MSQSTQSFDEWCESHAAAFRTDPVWHSVAYRMAAFLADIAWPDLVILDRHRITRPTAAQLYHAIGSVGANISEGFSRSSGRDRARIYEYALGSAREAIFWYRCAIHVLGADRVRERTELLLQIVYLLLRTIPTERKRPGRLRD